MVNRLFFSPRIPKNILTEPQMPKAFSKSLQWQQRNQTFKFSCYPAVYTDHTGQFNTKYAAICRKVTLLKHWVHYFEMPINRIKCKTAITLTPPTVGRQSADLSANKMPDFSSFFIGRQKINYNYLVIFFFPSADSFGVLAIGR